MQTDKSSPGDAGTAPDAHTGSPTAAAHPSIVELRRLLADDQASGGLSSSFGQHLSLLEREIDALRETAAKLEADLAQALRARDASLAQLGRSRAAALNQIAAERITATAQVKVANETLSAQRDYIAQLEAGTEALLRSRSWRMTKPIRASSDLLRRVLPTRPKAD